MGEWNAMTYEGKDTILRVVRREAEQMFALADRPELWESPTACEGWQVRDVIAHIVDTTEGYFTAFDAARGQGEAPSNPLARMAEMVNDRTLAFRGTPQVELMDRLKADFHKLQEMLAPLGPDDWTGYIVTHPYMGPVPAFFYAAGQLMDYGVHSWDIREGLGQSHALSGDVADLLVPFMFEVWRATVRTDRVTEPFSIGIRVSGANGGDYRFDVSAEGIAYAPGDIESLPAYLEFDAGSMVLKTYGRGNFGTVRGDQQVATEFLNLFFPI